MIARLRSALFLVVFYGGSVPLVLAGGLLAPFSHTTVLWVAHAWSVWFVTCARVLLGIRLVVRGTLPQDASLVAFKHQSAFETFLTLYLFLRPAVIMKAELRRVPVWGYLSARHGSIFVERDRKQGALLAMLRQARARTRDGRPVVIFPEGTRVPAGQAPPLRAGLSALYAALKVPVVAVAHDSAQAWPKGWVKRPGVVTMLVSEPIPPGLDRDEVETRVHAAINADPRA